MSRWLLLAGALLSVCPATAQPVPDAPRSAMPAMISWFEIPVTDLARARRFYEAVFGVIMTVETVDGYDMAIFPTDGAPEGAPGGALVKGDVYVPGKAGPILYFRVADIDRVMARAITAGGRSLYAKKDIGANGWVAEFEDSEGNRIALSQPR